MFEKIKAYFRPTPKSEYWILREEHRTLNLREIIRMKESMRSPFRKAMSRHWDTIRAIPVLAFKKIGIGVMFLGALGMYLLPLGILVALGVYIFG